LSAARADIIVELPIGATIAAVLLVFPAAPMLAVRSAAR
jgi:hypothetical protein